VITMLGDTVYYFGGFELFKRRQMLMHSGSQVAISSRSLAILTVLVDRAGGLATKAELTAAGWPSTFVHESSLKVSIAGIRRAFRAWAPGLEMIGTVSGQGYHFKAPVRIDRAKTLTQFDVYQEKLLPTIVSLVGRNQEHDDLCERLVTDDFVTLIGTGGVGKTSLALAVASSLKGENLAASFVDLSTIANTQHLAAAIVAELGIRSDSSDLLGAAIHALGDRPRLLILDNCEHLFPNIAAVAERLASGLPKVKILATSREPLGLARERKFSVAPLSFPRSAALGQKTTDDYESPAVQLFLARAHEARGNFQHEVSVIAEICERLDGLPLAIELAAALCQTYTPLELLDLLRKQLDLPEQETTERPARQRGLRATLDWSYGLLRPKEAAVFRALAVFARPFFMKEAIAIASAAGVGQPDASQCVICLSSKSLLSLDDRDGLLRYRFLDSTHIFASERLAKDHFRDRIEFGYAQHLCLSLEKSDEFQTLALGNGAAMQDAGWSADVRRVLIWAFSREERAQIGVRLALAALPLWERLSLLDESIVHLTSALEKARRHEHLGSMSEAKLQTALATALFNARGVTLESDEAWHRASVLAEELGDIDSLMKALWGSAAYNVHAGRLALATEQLTNLIALGKSRGDNFAVKDGERLLAAVEMYSGNLSGAILLLDDKHATDLHRDRFSDRRRFQVDRESAIGSTLALLKWLTGDGDGAAQLVESTVARAIEEAHPVSICNILILSAIPIAIFEDRLDDACGFMNLLKKQFEGRSLHLWAQMADCLAATLALRRGVPDSIERLQLAIDRLMHSGATIRVPIFLGMLAVAQIERGENDEAQMTISSAIALARVQQEKWVIPELLRIEARLAIALGDQYSAAVLLKRAIEAATNMKAETWRRRASADLGQLQISA
jgi:predicted ATPase/DNA-binding winged helix-turn-helix (wHTH) protein